MNILIRTKNFDKKVINFIYDKQRDFKKQKGRMVSLEKTVEKLIKDAYLKESKPKKLKRGELLHQL